jgi:hypothetical protein
MSDYRCSCACIIVVAAADYVAAIFRVEGKSAKKFERVLCFEKYLTLIDATKASCDAPHGECVSG